MQNSKYVSIVNNIINCFCFSFVVVHVLLLTPAVSFLSAHIYINLIMQKFGGGVVFLNIYF